MAEDLMLKETYIYDMDPTEAVRLRELNAKGSIKPFPASNPDYMHRKALGFYRNFNNVDDESPESWLARKTVCTASNYIVALSCTSPNEDEFPLNSSGIVVEYDGTKRILTSTYIFGGRSEILTLKVDVFLPNGTKVCGSVSYADIENNIVLIHAELGDTGTATLMTEFVDLGAQVLSLGLHSEYGIMACRGTITARKDDLDSDELMSSNCAISEVTKGSPADHAGIFINDIITSCNGIDLSSSVQLAELLLNLGKGKPRAVKFVIQRTGFDTTLSKTIEFQDLTSPYVTRWPVVPLELSFNEFKSVLFCSG